MTKRALAHILTFVAGGCAALLALTYWPAPTPREAVVFRTSVEPARTTEDLAYKLTPHVQQFLADHKQDFVDHAGGPMERTAVRWGIPVAQREAPVVLEHGLDKLAEEMSSWSVGDVVAWLASVADKRGLPEGRLSREMRATEAAR